MLRLPDINILNDLKQGRCIRKEKGDQVSVRNSLVLYGDIDTSSNSLLNLITFLQDYCNETGFPVTHYGLIGDSFTSGKILSKKRTERRLKTSIGKKEKIECVSLFSLPLDFSQAAFDYEMYIHIELEPKKQFILFTFPQDLTIVYHENIIKDLSDFINVEIGEIFEMSVYESPHFYASKINKDSNYESLKIIKKITEFEIS